MKAFIVLATLVACSSAAWVFLPLPDAGNRPELLPPSVDPIHPNRPEVDPIYPGEPENPIVLPPGILPEVPIVPPKPELPKPKPPLAESNVHSEILNFPSDDDPQIRVHVNIKKDMHENTHRPARSIFNWPSFTWPGVKPEVPEIGNRPELPEMGNKPELPEMGNKPELPEMGNKPELPILPPGNLPEVLPPPEISFPTPIVPPPATDGVYTYIYPNPQHQLVKLRVQYNKPADEINHKPAPEIPEMTPYKLELPDIDNRPALPEWGHKPELPIEPPSNLPEGPENPIIPMPIPPIGGHKTPQVELFLDIGEPDIY